MSDFSRVEATCKHCEEKFVLPGIEVKTQDFKSGRLNNPLLSAIYFTCPRCGEYNNFTFEQLDLSSS